jgi:predicted DNA-binding transcriptional regulator AlpA
METVQDLLLTESETARRLGVSVSGLRKWRREGQGPRFIRLGSRLIRYSVPDLDAWLLTSTQEPNLKSSEQ